MPKCVPLPTDPALAAGGGASAQLLATIGEVYSAATDPAGRAGADEAIRRALDCTGLHWLRLDLTGQPLDALPQGVAALVEQLHWTACELDEDQVLPLGGHALAGIVQRGASIEALLVTRPPQSPTFDGPAAGELAQLLPHLRQASRIRRRLDTEGTPDPAGVLRCLPLPWLLTDHAGRCLERNHAFDAVMASLPARLSTGRVRLRDAGVQTRWDAALRATHETAVGRAIPLAGADGRSWKAHIIPLRDALPAGAWQRLMLMVLEERPVGTDGKAARRSRRQLLAAIGVSGTDSSLGPDSVSSGGTGP